MGITGPMALRVTYDSFKEDSLMKAYIFVACVGLLGGFAGFAFSMAQHLNLMNKLISFFAGWVFGIIITAMSIWSYPDK